jgi:hypothetical protein
VLLDTGLRRYDDLATRRLEQVPKGIQRIKQKSRIAMSQFDIMVTRLLFNAGREHLFHFDALHQNSKR